MSGSLPTDDEVLAVLDSSGYLLEQDVAYELEDRGYHVRIASAFEDADEGTSREIDVTAFKQLYLDDAKKFSISLSLIVECKNWSAPLVFIGRRSQSKRPYMDPLEFMFPRKRYRIPEPGSNNTSFREVSGFARFDVAELHYYHNQDVQTAQFCRLIRRKTWELDQGGVYDSLVYPLAKGVLASRKRYEGIPGRGFSRSDWHSIHIIVPMLVTTAPMYYVFADRQERTIRQVTHTSYSRELAARNVRGTFTIDFVTRSGLGSFVSSVLEPFGQKMIQLAQNAGESLFEE